MKKIIYLYKSGELARRDYSLVFITKNNHCHYIPIEQTDFIMCFGEITFNKRVLGLLNIYHVPMMFFNYYGHYIGQYSPKKYANGKLIVQQVLTYHDDEKRLYLARTFTYGELKNCLALIKYYHRKEMKLGEIIDHLETTLNEIKACSSIEALMLIEAKAKKIYYSAFDIILRNSIYSFDVRSKHPPKNEVNCLLSYGYSLLYSTVLSDIDKSSLMAQVSFVHSLSKQSDSLQFDIADILKPVFIDRLVLRLVRKNQLKSSYFEYSDDTCFLNKEGIKFFVLQYENLLEKSIHIQHRYYSYRNLITREVFKISDYILEKNKVYKPYVMEW